MTTTTRRKPNAMEQPVEQPATVKPVDILARTPPSNLDAEKGVLSSIILDPDRLDEVSLILRGDDFLDESHGFIYTAIQHLASHGIKPYFENLASYLQQTQSVERAGGTAGLYDIAKCMPHSSSAEYLAGHVLETAQLRRLIVASSESIQAAYDRVSDTRDILDRSERRLMEIGERNVSSKPAPSIGEIIRDAYARIGAGEEVRGMKFGWSDLDEFTRMRNGELIIVAARPGVGKSSFAMNIMRNVCERGDHEPILFFSVEMALEQLGDRMLSLVSGVSGHKMASNTLTAMERQRLVEASARLSEYKLVLDDAAGKRVSDMAAISRRMKRKSGLGLVLIDYLQIIDPEDRRVPRQEQVAFMTRRLKLLARELKVPIVCLCQLNRESERTGQMPGLHNLRESGAIEQDADSVLFIHRVIFKKGDEPAGYKENQGLIELRVAKQRMGPTRTIAMQWDGPTARFSMSSDRNQEANERYGDGQAYDIHFV